MCIRDRPRPLPSGRRLSTYNLSRDGRLLTFESSSGDGLFDVQNAREVDIGSTDLTQISVSPNGRYVSSVMGQRLVIHDIETGISYRTRVMADDGSVTLFVPSEKL